MATLAPLEAGMRNRRRCGFCRCLYVPDARTAERQRSCAKVECQKRRRAETQRRYRESRPGDAEARRYRAAVALAKGGKTPPLPAPAPAVMGRQLWGEMRDEIRPEVFVTLVYLARLLAKEWKDEFRLQVTEVATESAKSLVPLVKDVSPMGPAPP